jgi:hypothetical protein
MTRTVDPIPELERMRMRLSRLAVLTGITVAAVALPLATPGVAFAAPPAPGTHSDVREIAPGKVYDLGPDVAKAKADKARARRAAPSVAAAVTPPVGTVRNWLALDDFNGRTYLKPYTLKAVGSKIEVWVANDTAFPAGDCREAIAGTTQVTDAQAQSLAAEFDNNMFPKESAAFSTAPSRDGSHSQVAGDFSGSGDKIVTLVDNVRDDNFYDFANAPTYIAGFFSSQFNELLDRNIMTIDAFDWLHRTGANPPDAPTSNGCTSRPARPRLYEGTFAHEYQHLLQYYTDPSEVNFINEGLSDFAITLTGYGNSTASVFEPGSEGHITCYQGYGTVKTQYNPNPRNCGGPQNSLTLWGDEGSGSEILADYGNGWSFQLYLFDHYGLDFISDLHRDGAEQGLNGVQAMLDKYAPGTKVVDVVHNYQVMGLVDAALGKSGEVTGAKLTDLTTANLNSKFNLENPAVNAIPGAAPNGADYVRLADARRPILRGNQLRSLVFKGATTLPPVPLKWTSVTNAPGREGNPTLWSGNESNLDVAAVTEVTVPATNAVLTYQEKHLAEATYDYAYTVVSTDGGVTYTPLANENTVDGPFGPALNGDADSFVTQTFDLSAYAGQKVLVGFRYVSDGGVNDGGWFVDDVAVGGTLVSDASSTAGFRSPSEITPTKVANWNLRLVGISEKNQKVRVETFNGVYSLDKDTKDLKNFAGYDYVVAVVSYDDPTEQVQQYAPYTLVVNGLTQPGGTPTA